MISSTFRSVPYPRFVFVGYAASPPSAAPVRFPLESTPPSSRKGIAEDSAPFSPGRRFGFQRAVVNLPKTSVRKPSLCTLTAARKSCIMYPEYWRTIQAPSSPSVGVWRRECWHHSRPRRRRKFTPSETTVSPGVLFWCASIISKILSTVKDLSKISLILFFAQKPEGTKW